MFGRRDKPSLTYGLELWALGGDMPVRKSTVACEPFSDDTLMHLNTARLAPEQVPQSQMEIDLVMPGLLAVLAGRGAEWRKSRERSREDAYFTPLETISKRPAHSPAFSKVDDPLLFGSVMRQMNSVLPSAPQGMPWADMTNRQKWFLNHVLRGWNFHARTPFMAMPGRRKPTGLL